MGIEFFGFTIHGDRVLTSVSVGVSNATSWRWVGFVHLHTKR